MCRCSHTRFQHDQGDVWPRLTRGAFESSLSISLAMLKRQCEQQHTSKGSWVAGNLVMIGVNGTLLRHDHQRTYIRYQSAASQEHSSFYSVIERRFSTQTPFIMYNSQSYKHHSDRLQPLRHLHYLPPLCSRSSRITRSQAPTRQKRQDQQRGPRLSALQPRAQRSRPLSSKTMHLYCTVYVSHLCRNSVLNIGGGKGGSKKRERRTGSCCGRNSTSRVDRRRRDGQCYTRDGACRGGREGGGLPCCEACRDEEEDGVGTHIWRCWV
ncbi:hypothetical protein QBC35DRAFT_274537 [Podospora australis]|uniref:Uncharacterized protein n=1 Tax=Podospora australis TaxID=1536484 RepID=A0AAN6WQK0_9PEZI|nr:hypothetical protein QBC35DRAFT_274537 [Podospora australis]